VWSSFSPVSGHQALFDLLGCFNSVTIWSTAIAADFRVLANRRYDLPT